MIPKMVTGARYFTFLDIPSWGTVSNPCLIPKHREVKQGAAALAAERWERNLLFHLSLVCDYKISINNNC